MADPSLSYPHQLAHDHDVQLTVAAPDAEGDGGAFQPADGARGAVEAKLRHAGAIDGHDRVAGPASAAPPFGTTC